MRGLTRNGLQPPFAENAFRPTTGIEATQEHRSVPSGENAKGVAVGGGHIFILGRGGSLSKLKPDGTEVWTRASNNLSPNYAPSHKQMAWSEGYLLFRYANNTDLGVYDIETDSFVSRYSVVGKDLLSGNSYLNRNLASTRGGHVYTIGKSDSPPFTLRTHKVDHAAQEVRWVRDETMVDGFRTGGSDDHHGITVVGTWLMEIEREETITVWDRLTGHKAQELTGLDTLANGTKIGYDETVQALVIGDWKNPNYSYYPLPRDNIGTEGDRSN